MKIFKIGVPLVVSGTLVACAVLLLRNHLQYQGIVEDVSPHGVAISTSSASSTRLLPAFFWSLF